MVRSRYLTPEHLIRAIKAGSFYASSGVSLSEIEFDADLGEIRLRVLPEEGATYTVQFVGTLSDYDRATSPRLDQEGNEIATTRIYSAGVGRVLHTVRGTKASYQLTGKELYARAVVTSSKPHPDPTFDDQFEQAWTQPLGWKKMLRNDPKDPAEE